jgi:hypothetical protein
MYVLPFFISLLSLPMSVVSMTCLDDPWHEGFLPKLFNLHVVNLCESFCLAWHVVEPLSGCGGSCPCAMACSATIERGGMFVVLHWASLQGSGCCRPEWSAPDIPFERAPRRPAFSSGSCFLGPQGVFNGFVWLDDVTATVVWASASAPQVSHSCGFGPHRARCSGSSPLAL